MSVLSKSEPGNARYYDYHGWIRRIDLSLRTRYPNLETRIFETAPNRYVIVFDRTLLDAVAIREEFDSIRFVTTNAVVANDVPERYLREITPLGDEEIARDFAGIPFTQGDLSNLLAAQFPNLPITAVRDGGDPMTITIELSESISKEDEEGLLRFCQDLEAVVPWQIIVAPGAATLPAKEPLIPVPGMKTFVPDLLSVRATRWRPYLPEYARRDEAFWFENIDKIYAGLMPVESFPGVQRNQSQCFLDLTAGDHINLRQALLLYDTVYCSPPLREEYEIFLQKQMLSEADLLYLIEKGRLKIISTQAEERLNLKFLEAASERNSTAIIGRRSTAAILIADIVLTADEYQLAKPDLLRGVGELAKLLGEQSGIDPDEILRILLWPVQARRGSLMPLLNRGSKGIASIGLAGFMSRHVKRLVDKDVELEALVLSERVHIGHALNATVFPNRSDPPGLLLLMNIMADALNFYRSFNTRVAVSWAGNEERKATGKLVMPPLPLFEFEPRVPIEEFLEAVRLHSTRAEGLALFGRLAALPEDQRADEIARLDAELRKRLRRSESAISFENLDTLISIGSSIFSFLYPPVAGLRAIGRQLKESVRNIPSVDRLVHEIETNLFSAPAKQEIDFLSRISRVATFKKDRIS